MKRDAHSRESSAPACCQRPEPKVSTVKDPTEFPDGNAGTTKAEVAPQGAVYTCPMHPEVKRLAPGSCPICGMALEPLDVSPTDEEQSPEFVDFSRRLKWASLLVVPLLILAMGEMTPGN